MGDVEESVISGVPLVHMKIVHALKYIDEDVRNKTGNRGILWKMKRVRSTYDWYYCER